MISTQKDLNKNNLNEVKLELYTLLGEGYREMKDGQEISVETLKKTITKRRKKYE